MKLRINSYYNMRSGWTVQIVKKQDDLYVDADGHTYSSAGKSSIHKSCDLVRLASKNDKENMKEALDLVEKLVKIYKRGKK